MAKYKKQECRRCRKKFEKLWWWVVAGEMAREKRKQLLIYSHLPG